MSTVKERVERFELNAKKTLGQNFILDTNLLNKIAKMALMGLHPKTVIEIGPGPGGLTQALLEQGVSLIAVEKDERCLAVLQELKELYPNTFQLLNADALAVSEEELGEAPRVIVANLPYNISTILLIKWLEKINQFDSLTLMFQKEVADRLMAKPNSKVYGRLSVLTQWLCQVDELMVLPPAVFTPRPKIMSSLVRLTPRKKTILADFKTMERVLAIAFNQRRKMLHSSLKPLGNVDLICEKACIDSTLRAENLTVEAYCRLAQVVFQEG